MDHLAQRRAGEKDLIHAIALHYAHIVVRDRAAAAAEDRNVVCTFCSELPNNFRKKFDVTAIITRDTDGSDILLNSGANDIADITVETEVYDFNAVANEFEIDC